MERLIFEGRFLVNVVGGIIRKDDLRVLSGRIDWERMFRTADYHKITGIMYLASLGYGDSLPEKWQERLFERFGEILRFGDSCEERQREIFVMLDMMKLPVIVLSSCELRKLYPTPEMASIGLLKMLFGEEDYVRAKGYLVDLGYETDRFLKNCGEHMKHPDGFDIEIYHKLSFYTKLYDKNLKAIMETAVPWKNMEFVKTLPVTSQFSYMLAKAAYDYVTDNLRIRDVLDLYLFYQRCRETLDMERVWKWLADLQIDGLGKKILNISCMWFGKGEEIPEEQKPEEDMTVYDVLENRILSQGAINQECDKQALTLERQIKREIEKEQLREKRAARIKQWEERRNYIKRVLQWAFPKYSYMCSLYPILETMPFLLPLFWLWRGLRQIRHLLRG